MGKWRKIWARGNIANRWLFNQLWDMFSITMKGKRKNPVWFGEAVWLDNLGMEWMDDDCTKPFQAAVRRYFKKLKDSPGYRALQQGVASDELMENTLSRYKIIRKCHC